MNLNLSELKALATAAQRAPYDHVAANDYGMAMPPAITLELIAEIERQRLINAEGCKPDSSILLAGRPCAGGAPYRSLDKAKGCKPDLIITPPQPVHSAELSDVLPTVSVEGDQLVIRITTECLLHAVTCCSQWPIDATGAPVPIVNGALLVEEIIHELQREDEQGTNAMHRMLDDAALAALDNGSEAVAYDEVSS
ncbi:hypothetical protein LOY42_20440 [Pseudomonas sp. B21-023]|uniref:hypothetical protein n=1 Tax=Pseudomonas sp. B21-023 TaxID=2895477 RepID=UPI002160A58F|nr:hypothetical protein [Pseudomonas sp. B21-023]UVM15614.1 hypothetical protein LOY42_20440 [Pseudomonas sp. B21-023]